MRGHIQTRNLILYQHLCRLMILPCHAKSLQSCMTLSILCTVAHQAPLSVGFSRQEYWSGLWCPPPGITPSWPRQLNPSLLCHTHYRQILYHWATGEAQWYCNGHQIQKPNYWIKIKHFVRQNLTLAFSLTNSLSEKYRLYLRYIIYS